MKDYKTVFSDGYYLYEEKRSKFIARVKPINSENEAISFINEIRAECWDASHNCFAYNVAGESTYQRYSDDGEPLGTAGMPILEVIKKRQLYNLVIVVTRYFGGTLLGAGGLVRAYSKAAAGCIENAGEIWIKTCIEAEIHIEYHLSGKIQNMLINDSYIIVNTSYSDKVSFKVLLDESGKDALEEKLNDLTGGTKIIHYTGKKAVKLDKLGKLIEVD